MEERFPTGAPSEDEFAALAESELDALPGWIKSAIAGHNVAISIEDQQPGEEQQERGPGRPADAPSGGTGHSFAFSEYGTTCAYRARYLSRSATTFMAAVTPRPRYQVSSGTS